MKIIFIGTVDFSLRLLTTLIDAKAKIVGVITSKNSEFNSDYADLTPVCKKNAIPILLCDNINSKITIQWIKKHYPDIIFCMGWSRLIKKELLDLPPFGVLGYHPAALPMNRGRHPLIWALVLGLEKTASTFFLMDEGADSGDILSQQEVVISKEEDARSLYNKVAKTASKQILKIISMLSRREIQSLPQDHSKANTWRKRGIKDGEIDWRMSAVNIDNLVRALSHPYVGAHLMSAGQEYKVWKSKVHDCPEFAHFEHGKVLKITKGSVPIIKCGTACIELLEVEPYLSLNVGDYL